MSSATEQAFWALWEKRDYAGLYQLGIDAGDPRVENWLFMQTPVATLVLTALYLFLVFYGKRVMKDRQAFDVTLVKRVYNFAMVGLSAYMFLETCYLSIASKYNYGCDLVDYSNDPLAIRMAAVLWWYYFSKFIEFLDTFFMVLTKHNKQISFLHVYHHASMFCIWWMGVKWVPGGQSFFGAMINSFVHIWMYLYYLLRSYKVHIPKTIKKGITQMQLVQFFIAIGYAILSLRNDCAFPHWMHWALLLYVCSMVVLFGNFYLYAYVFKKTDKKKDAKKVQ